MDQSQHFSPGAFSQHLAATVGLHDRCTSVSQWLSSKISDWNGSSTQYTRWKSHNEAQMCHGWQI